MMCVLPPVGVQNGAQQAHRKNIAAHQALYVRTLDSFLRYRSALSAIPLDSFADDWPAPGSEDTELGVLMEPEVGHGETEVYARVQA
jgi:hypothetical protein